MECRMIDLLFFFFSSRRRHTRCREVSWARRCVQETGSYCCLNLDTPMSNRCLPCLNHLVGPKFLFQGFNEGQINSYFRHHISFYIIRSVQAQLLAVSISVKLQHDFGLYCHISRNYLACVDNNGRND
eukprot:TRINITY_DN42528_c0_g1_i1.p1 TRINITY_DN42528_c0_g1~~TRINITY_DN42528_c0_g1_i1.p1  ORF type:complete len:128 (+),score=20.21 TRINITY_DN42528_c0_g1_i1:52-435(+)